MAQLGDYLEQVSEYTKPAQEGVQEAGEAYTGMLKEGASLPDQLKQAVQQKLDYNKDLISQRSQAASQYFAAPAEARAQYSDIHDPFEREKLVSQYRAQQLQPYSTLTDLLGQRMGNVSDIIGTGIQGWQGMTDAAQAATGLAQQQYGNVMNQYGMGADMYQQAQSREMQRAQMENQMKAEQARLALEKMLGLQGISLQKQQLGMQQEQADWERPWQEKLYEYELGKPYYKPGGGGTGTGTGNWPPWLEEWIKEKLNGQDTTETTTGEEKPKEKPKISGYQYSPGGEWVYRSDMDEWFANPNFQGSTGSQGVGEVDYPEPLEGWY